MKNFIKNIFGISEKNVEVSGNNNMSVCFLVVGSSADTSADTTAFKRYIGVGKCKVLAFNPTEKQFTDIMGYTPKAENFFKYTDKNQDNKETCKLMFLIGTNPEKCNGIDLKGTLIINLTNEYKLSQSGKYKVCDNFGSNTAWGDAEVVKAGKPIVYSTGNTANFVGKYHPLYTNEEYLIDFFRSFLGIPGADNWVNGSPVRKTGEDLKKAEFALDNIKDYFKGDFSEIKEALALQPNNEVKILFGIRTTDDGRQYQDVNARIFASARSTSNNKIEKYINREKENGQYTNTEYEFTDLHEYNPQATNFEAPAEDNGDLPFGTAETSATPW